MVELLAVIAILGLLAGVLAPSISGAFQKANRNTANTNLGQIIKAVNAYGDIISEDTAVDSKGSKNVTSVATYAELLAQKGLLESGTVWYVPQDNKVPQEIPKTVIRDGTNQLESQKSVAWAVVVNAKNNRKNRETYPLIWTRGLGVEGSWDAEEGVWGDAGGHIAFWDGHSVWVDNVTDTKNKFVKADDNKNTQTSSYIDAIGTSKNGKSPKVFEDK